MTKLEYLDAEDQVVGTITINDTTGKVEATGMGNDAVHMTVVDPETDQIYTPADGEKWLQALRYCYRTHYLRLAVKKEES